MAKIAVGSAVEAYFVKLGAMLLRHRSEKGITTSALFRRGRRGGKSDGGSRANAAHVTTFAKSADSRSCGRGRCATPDAPRSRYRTDIRRSSLSRTRPRVKTIVGQTNRISRALTSQSR